MFAKFLRKMEADETVDFDINKRFVMPDGELGIELDCEVYQRQIGSFANPDENGRRLWRGRSGWSFSTDRFSTASDR